MTAEPVNAAEVIEPLNRESAERLDRRIRLLVGTIHDQIAKLYGLVAEAKQGNVHAALGYPSWTAYLSDVFTVDVRLEREQRQELVSYLSGEGMSQRAIADVVNADQATVSRDLATRMAAAATEAAVSVVRDANASPDQITGLDGKTYKRKPPKPKPPLEPDDEPVSVLRATADVTQLLVEMLYKRHPLTLDNAEDIQHAATILDNLDAIEGFIEAARQSTGTRSN